MREVEENGLGNQIFLEYIFNKNADVFPLTLVTIFIFCFSTIISVGKWWSKNLCCEMLQRSSLPHIAFRLGPFFSESSVDFIAGKFHAKKDLRFQS